MNEAEVISICRESILILLKICGPILLLGLLIGVAVSLFQIITQIQEPALTFVPKMAIIFAAALFLMPFMLSTLENFMHQLGDRIVNIDKGD